MIGFGSKCATRYSDSARLAPPQGGYPASTHHPARPCSAIFTTHRWAAGASAQKVAHVRPPSSTSAARPPTATRTILAGLADGGSEPAGTERGAAGEDTGSGAGGDRCGRIRGGCSDALVEGADWGLRRNATSNANSRTHCSLSVSANRPAEEAGSAEVAGKGHAAPGCEVNAHTPSSSAGVEAVAWNRSPQKGQFRSWGARGGVPEEGCGDVVCASVKKRPQGACAGAVRKMAQAGSLPESPKALLSPKSVVGEAMASFPENVTSGCSWPRG